MAAVGGQSNDFPTSECTWWASERYHELTGLYVPWSGNAADWSSVAPSYGWTVSASPVAPSIICLQPGVQGASPQFGHVGVVESINGAQIQTSNLNWQPSPGQITNVTHQGGPGVSFIYANGPGGTPLFQLRKMGASLKTALGNSPIQLAPNADVTSFLYEMDRVLDLVNPFGNVAAKEDSIVGVSFTDPISWLEGFGLNVVSDLTALILRAAFVLVGIIVLYKVMSSFLDIGVLGSTIGGLF